MSPELLGLLACPICHAQSLKTAAADAGHIEHGQVVCADCGRAYPVREGILDLHPSPSEAAQQEMDAHRQLGAQWFTEQVPERLRHLFEGEQGVQTALGLPRSSNAELAREVEAFRRMAALADDYFELLDWLDLQGTETVVEVGADTGWSARHLAERAGRVVATDISHQLAMAGIYVERARYFDRVFCDMAVFPFRPESLDLVFGVAVLHHAGDLCHVLGRFHAALKPGGRAIFFAEPVAGRWDAAAKEAFGADEKALGVQEHIYTVVEYLRASRAAGLRPSVIPLSGLLHDTTRRWRFMRRLALLSLKTGLGYTRPCTNGLYPFLLQFYPRIPFPQFALVFEKV